MPKDSCIEPPSGAYNDLPLLGSWQRMTGRFAEGAERTDCGIELPQERDMAVRMIDVPATGRAQDRGGRDRYRLRTIEDA